MADESIVIEVKDSVDNSIAVKIKAIATEARSAFKDLGTLQDKLSALGVSKLGSISRELDGGATATAKLATAQANLATAQQKTVAATATATSALSKLQKAQDEAALSTLRLQQAQNKLASTKPVVSDGQKFVQSLEAQAAAIGKTQSELLAMKAAQLGVTAQAAPFIDALNKQGVQFDKNGLSAKQYSAAMRGVPAQITDIVVSLQGGQAPMTVLLQQGGQLKDMFGGIVPAAKALGNGLLGLINPYTLVAGAVIGLVAAYLKGSSEGENFNKSLIQTGNYAGTTGNKLSVMAESINVSSGITVSASAEALTALVSTGNIASKQFENLAASSVRWQKATGIAVEDTAKQFAELGKDPLKASIKLNESTNYLTESVYKQIKALMEQGDVLKAGEVAQNAWASVLDKRAPQMLENLGLVERGWNAITGAIKGAVSAMAGIGRPVDPSTDLKAQIAVLESKIANEKTGAAYDPMGTAAQLRIYDAQLVALKEQLGYAGELDRIAKRSAESTALDAQNVKARAAWESSITESLSKQEKMTLAIAEAKGKFEGVTNKSPDDVAKYAKQILDIQEKYKEAPKHIKAVTDEYENVYSSIRKAIEVSAEELDSNKKLSESDKFRIDTLDKINKAYQDTIKSKTKSASAALAEANAAKSAMSAGEAIIAENEKRKKSQAEAFKADQDGYKAMHDLQKQAEQDYKSVTKASEEYLASAKEQADVVNSESNLYALNTEQRKLAIEQYKIEAEWKTKIAEIDARTNLSDAEKDTAKARITSAMTIKINTATRKSVQDGWLETADKIRDGLTDAFMEAINGTKSLWVALRDAVVGMFSNMVLRPIIQGVMQPIATAVTGSLIGTAANAATGASATSGLFGSAGSIASMGAQFGSAASITMSNGMIAGFGANMSNIAGQLAAGSYTSALGMALPYLGAAVAAFSVLNSLGVFGSNFISATDSGRARVDYSSAGVGGNVYSTTGDAAQIAAAQTSVEKLAQSYFETAAKLGIDAMAATFEVGSNTGKEGANPQTVLGVNIGKVGYSSGEIASGDSAALTLAASRAVLTALQASDMPDYLQSVFDDLTASSATQDQITAALNYASTLKTVRDSLTETRDSAQILADNIKASRASLGTSAESFKADFLAAIDGGLTEADLTKWQALSAYLDQATAAADALAKTNQGWQDKLDILTGARTSTQVELANALAAATDESTKAIIRQVYAQQDAKNAAQTATDAAAAAAQAASDAAEAIKKQQDAAYSALQRAVSAQSKIDTVARDAAQELVTQITSVFDLLQTNVSALYGQVDSTAAMQSSQGNVFITQALSNAKSTGYLPDSKDLQAAITSARGGVDAAVYASQADADFARLELAGRLDELKTISGRQLTEADNQLELAQKQLDGLDGILEAAQSQIDALNGIDTSVLSVADAVRALQEALKPTTTKPTTTTTTTTGSSGGFGGIQNTVSAGYGSGFGGIQSTYTPVTTNTNFGMWSSAEAQQIANSQGAEDYLRAITGGVEASQALQDQYLASYVNQVLRGSLPSYDVGTNFVPKDGLAFLHEGEAVTPKAWNPAIGGGVSSVNTDRLESLIEGLTAEVRRLQSIVDRGNEYAATTANRLTSNQPLPVDTNT